MKHAEMLAESQHPVTDYFPLTVIHSMEVIEDRRKFPSYYQIPTCSPFSPLIDGPGGPAGPSGPLGPSRPGVPSRP